MRWEQSKRKARARYVRQVCSDISSAMHMGDLHCFYALLPKLGIYVFGRTSQGEEPHSLEQIAEFLELCWGPTR